MPESGNLRIGRLFPLPYMAGAAAIAALMFALNLPNVGGQSVTVDEYAHLPAGYSYLHKREFGLYSKNPPLIKMIEALPVAATEPQFSVKAYLDAKGGWGPWQFADSFVNDNRVQARKMWGSARIVVMLMSVSLAVVVFVWASSLYGPKAGLVAMFLTATSPNMLAHSSLATVDLGFTLFFVLALFMLWKFWNDNLTSSLILASVAFGAAQISKFSGVLMLPILAAVFCGLLIRNQLEGESRMTISAWQMLKNILMVGTIIVGMSLVVINTGYMGKRVFEPLADNVGQSGIFGKIAKGGLGSWRMPLPADYLHGLDAQLADAERGEFPNYINGEWRKEGVWYYFLEALALKETIPALSLIILGLFVGLWRAAMRGIEMRPMRQSIGRGQPAWPFVHLPAAVFLLISSAFGNLQIGVRYVLPILPLLYIAASRAVGVHRTDVRTTSSRENFLKWALGVLTIVFCLWQGTETGAAAPNFLSYFNEFAGGSKRGHEYLIDSNIDWGQNLPALKKEMDKLGIKEIGLLYFGHIDPKLYGIDYHLPHPDDPFVAVSVNFLYGYPYSLTYAQQWSSRPPMVTDAPYVDSFIFAQSLIAVEPAERIGGSIYLYDLRGM